MKMKMRKNVWMGVAVDPVGCHVTITGFSHSEEQTLTDSKDRLPDVHYYNAFEINSSTGEKLREWLQTFSIPEAGITKIIRGIGKTSLKAMENKDE